MKTAGKRPKRLKPRYLLCIALVLSFAVFCGFALAGSFTPYVTFGEAREISGDVQVNGELAGAVTTSAEGVSFTLRDAEGAEAHVIYAGAKPENIEHSESLAVIGSFDGDIFRASQILVKCPSKYQAQDDGAKEAE